MVGGRTGCPQGAAPGLKPSGPFQPPAACTQRGAGRVTLAPGMSVQQSLSCASARPSWVEEVVGMRWADTWDPRF